MSDAVAPAPAVKSPKKKTVKPKKPASHPKYSEMIAKAISDLKERGGSSRQAILKYIVKNYKVDEKGANSHLKMALRAGVKNSSLKQSKGTGASGSFRLGEKKAAAKPKKAKVAKKSPKKVKKPKAAAKPKTAKAKKTKSPKKAAKPKKTPTKKAAKPKSVKKSPAAKKPAKPKAKKPAAKKTAKKPAAKKGAAKK